MTSGSNPAVLRWSHKLRLLSVGVLLLMQPGCMCGCSRRHAPGALATGAFCARETCSQCLGHEEAEHVEADSARR